MSCEKAFSLAPLNLPCDVKVKTTNPECGHKAEVECHQKQAVDADPRHQRTLPQVSVVKEGNSRRLFMANVFNITCSETVVLERRWAQFLSISSKKYEFVHAILT